jgi:K(+)-stimulated pyrophosphate-energized sodium pump
LIDPLLFPFIVGIVAILVATYLIRNILKRSPGSERMREVSGYIINGTKAYLDRQIKTIALVIPVFAIVVFLIFFYQSGFDIAWKTAVSFLSGSILSLLAGFIGMNVAVRANVRAANAAMTSSSTTLKISFYGGAVTGLLVTGISLLGMFFLKTAFNDPQPLVGFGFGASLAALFAQIGGGIFTKSADIGADLVGKVEEDIPEDDPRNPAVVADLVGDNVGDCAGRGSDMFQTFSDDICTGMLLGAVMVTLYGYSSNYIAFPFVLEAVGVVGSIIGIMFVRQWKKISYTGSLIIGLIITALVSIVGLAIFAELLLQNPLSIILEGTLGIVAMFIAILAALYYTGLGRGPVKRVAKASQAGPAINVITGLSIGLESPILPIIAMLATVVITFVIAGGMSGPSAYAIVVTNISTDLVIGYIMASDTFGPITDNAAGIAEMSGVSEEAGKTLNELDAVGNTMKASTKAYAVASGTFTSFVIFITYFTQAKISNISVGTPYVFAAIFLGVVLPLPLASLTIRAAANGAFKMVDEVRRQFKEIPGLREGKATPDYEKCVDISTRNALRTMILPGILGVIAPIIIGLLFGPLMLGFTLVGATATCAMLGFFLNNTGALLDNAKKSIESGLFGGKGSRAHKAAVVGDTVGDPMKDVAGPALLIFMKLIGMTALLMLPVLIHV